MFSSEQKSAGQQRLWLISSLIVLLIVSAWRLLVGADWLANTVLAFTLSGVGLLLWFEWRKLRRVRQAYNMAMLAAHDGFWEWNPITKELRTGTRLLEILGYQHDFLPDTNAWLKLVHEDDISLYNKAVSEHLKGNSKYFYYEYRVRANNGNYIWVASRGIAVRDRHGRAYQMVGSVTDITERRNYQETMEFLAQHDDLTGLPNRLMLAEKLAQAIEQAQRTGQRLAICFIDLDRFKNINDTLGHRAGDQLLQSVALRLATNLPAKSHLFRQGGDEFIVLMQAIPDLSTALTAAGQLRELIATPFTSECSNLFTSASIGICLFPDDAEDGETLLKNADTAMYAAKAAGGNAVRTHTAQMNQRLLSRVTLETQLHSALQQNELALHFQAQVDTASGRLTGAEALLRWQHNGQNIPPDQFIPVAEDTGLILPIGDWVIDRAIAQIIEWRHLYGDIPPIAINLSPRQFWRPALSHQVLDKLRAAGLPASALEVEVTESVLLHAEAGSLDELENFRASGICIALDDFGTGYSSLSYLRRLPISILKIDRSFIIDLTSAKESETSQALVRAIIAMAHSLSLKVIAEGVETPEQRACLQALDCDVIQGYLISRPLPPKDFSAKFLVDRNK